MNTKTILHVVQVGGRLSGEGIVTAHHKYCSILSTLLRLVLSNGILQLKHVTQQVGGFSHRADYSRLYALHSCPYATITWSFMGGGTRQYYLLPIY